MDKYMVFADRAPGGASKERLVMVLDVSESMGEPDWKPSRLGGATEASRALIKAKASAYPEDEVGIVSFSARASLICAPIRLRDGAAHLARSLNKLRPDSSTNIAAGLLTAENALFGGKLEDSKKRTTRIVKWALRLLYDDPPQARVKASESGTCYRVILLTDGEHNEKSADPVDVAQELKGRGGLIDCIGIGGSPQEVNESDLKRIASTGLDGHPRYTFIGDKQALITKFKDLANHIRRA